MQYMYLFVSTLRIPKRLVILTKHSIIAIWQDSLVRVKWYCNLVLVICLSCLFLMSIFVIIVYMGGKAT